MQTLIKHLIQPILLISYMAIAHLYYGEVHPFLLLLSLITINLIILWCLEWIIPFKDKWRMDKKGLVENLKYFGLGAVADSIGKNLAILIAMKLTSGRVDFPLYYSVPMAVIAMEFFGYWVHRATHQEGFLWKVHAIHHTPDQIFTWNNNKMHPLNIILLKFGRLSSLIVIGFSPETIFLASVFGLLQNYISHVNADIKGGFFCYLIATPELHRLHHSSNKREALNYSAVIPYWDMLFGTFLYKENVKSIGVTNPDEYPSGVINEILFPFNGTKNKCNRDV